MNVKKLIIVPWDFSTHAEVALEYTRQRYADNDIIAICVLEPPNPYSPNLMRGPEADLQAIEKCRESFAEVVGLTDSNQIKFEILFGDPGYEIPCYANQLNTDYIVISTHGRTGLQRLMMGSVAQQVLAQANCPVILLPAK